MRNKVCVGVQRYRICATNVNEYFGVVLMEKNIDHKTMQMKAFKIWFDFVYKCPYVTLMHACNDNISSKDKIWNMMFKLKLFGFSEGREMVKNKSDNLQTWQIK